MTYDLLQVEFTAMPNLLVSEMYRSLQGEGTRAGRPCAIIRLAGCNLRCSWCDTQHAYEGGTVMSIQAMVEWTRQMRCRLAMLTGGEPLLQRATPLLLRSLCDEGLETLLMTNGSLDISGVDGRVIRCMDVKCPSSGQSQSMLWSNLACLRPADETKFVLADRNDYEFAAAVVREHQLIGRCVVIFSPAFGLLEPRHLAEWILADGLEVRLGLQLHKILWPEADRGV
jgi:7-carboxy-7-deazaguanine synthase